MVSPPPQSRRVPPRELLHCLLPLAVTLGPRGALPEVLRDSQAWSAAVAAGFAAEWSRHTGDAGHVGAGRGVVLGDTARARYPPKPSTPSHSIHLTRMQPLIRTLVQNPSMYESQTAR